MDFEYDYCQTSNVSCTIVDNKLVDHSDVVGASPVHSGLTHWGRVTHICVGKQTIIGSDNGLSPGRRQAIIWTNPGILFIGPLGTNFSEISIKILTFLFTKMHLKVSSVKWHPFCLGLNGLTPGFNGLGKDNWFYSNPCHHWSSVQHQADLWSIADFGLNYFFRHFMINNINS